MFYARICAQGTGIRDLLHGRDQNSVNKSSQGLTKLVRCLLNDEVADAWYSNVAGVLGSTPDGMSCALVASGPSAGISQAMQTQRVQDTQRVLAAHDPKQFNRGR